MLELPGTGGRWRGEYSNAPGQDGDFVDDYDDNCPLDANPDQADIGGDGRGDVCDLCPNHDKDHGRDSNLDSELLNYDEMLHDAHPVTMQEYVQPGYVERRRLHYQGDSCENAVALAPFSLAAQSFVPNPPMFCGPNCGVKANTKIEYATIERPVGQTAKYDFRFCQCPESNLSTAIRRIQCAKELVKPCSFKGAPLEEVGPNPSWRRSSIVGRPDEYFQRSFHSPDMTDSLAQSWAVAKDPALFDHSPTSPVDISVHGVLAAHVLKPALANDIGPDPSLPIAFRDRSTVFADGSVNVQQVKTLRLPTKGGLVGYFPHWKDCLTCGFGDRLPILVPDPLRGLVLADAGLGTFDFTPQLSSPLQALLLGSGRMVFAEEPAWALSGAGTLWLGVHLTDSLQADAIVIESGSGLDASRRPGTIPGGEVAPAASLGATSTAVFLGLGTKNQVIRLASTEAGSAAMSVYDVASGTWSDVPLVGSSLPRRVLTAAYRFSDDAIYAVDEEVESWHRRARLFRISRSGFVELVTQWTRLTTNTIALVTTERDELLFSFSTQALPMHAFLVARVGRNGVVDPVAFSAGLGAVSGRAQLTEHWLTALVTDGARTPARVLTIAREDLTPIRDFQPCAGWW